MPKEPKLRADLHMSGITDEGIEAVRRGMWKVVNEPGGTGKKAQVKGVEVAGKTGTAQFWRKVNGKEEKDNHTWFISFAPYNDPKFAVCVFVQGAKSGGGVSAPIAQRILEQAFALDKGYNPPVARMTPAVGSFAPIDEVNYKTGSAISGDGADHETADHTETPVRAVPRVRPTEVARPDIRRDADERGKVPTNPAQQTPAEKRSFFRSLFQRREEPPRAVPNNPANGRSR